MIKKISLITLFILILFLGIRLRLTQSNNPKEYLASNNVVSYYFDLANYYQKNNKILNFDKYRFAPIIVEENSPPLLFLYSSFFYKIYTTFNKIDFFTYAMYLPIFTNFIFSVIGFYFIYKLTKSYLSSFIFLFISNISSTSVFLTSYGAFKEEFLGVFLMFFSYYFYLSYIKKNRIYDLFYSMFFLTLLILTWQQFHITIIIYVFSLFFIKNKKNILYVLFGLLLSFLFSQLISVYILSSNYKPFSMLNEFYLGLIKYNDPMMRTAIKRVNWSNLGLYSYYGYFGITGLFFTISFIYTSLKEKKRTENIFTFICFSFSFLLMYFFTKSRFVFLAAFLLAIPTLSIQQIKDSFVFFIKIIFNKKNILILFVTVILFFLINHIYVISKSRPMPEITLYKNNNSVKIMLKNKNNVQSNDKNSFNGFHIEVPGKVPKNIKVWSKKLPKPIHVKKPSEGNVNWFEVKKYGFEKDDELWTSFDLEKIDEKTKIYVRSWIPADCSYIQRFIIWPDLRFAYSDFKKNTWRSEGCIVRSPGEVNDKNKTITNCLIEVYAAHKEKQIYKCYEY